MLMRKQVNNTNLKVVVEVAQRQGVVHGEEEEAGQGSLLLKEEADIIINGRSRLRKSFFNQLFKIYLNIFQCEQAIHQ